MKKIWNKFLSVTGISRNTKYVNDYLHEANMRSGIFMSLVIILLEAWLLFRQTNKYAIPSIAAGADVFKTLFTVLAPYFILLSFGVAMLFYCIQYGQKKKAFALTLVTLIAAGISAAFCCLLPLEFFYKSIKFTSQVNTIKGILKIIFYAFVFSFDVSAILVSLYRMHCDKKKVSVPKELSSVLIITLFALSCLAFGIYVSYGDFAVTDVKDPSTGAVIGQQYKMIICFLMMTIYVGCLLIWKPYISLGLLGAIFLGFYLLIDSVYNPTTGTGRPVPEGDEINYITFFISLTMVCFSIYNQRISEARKDEELELLATKDSLTGLYAFEYFLTLVDRKVKEEKTTIGDYIFLFLDITSFKIFNDQRGFGEGNKFLKDVGDILTQTFRKSLVSRQSDDHFAVFTRYEDIEPKLALLNMAIEKLDLDIRPGIKVGGYILRDKSEESHEAIEKARYACAELKKKPSGTLMIYDTVMHDKFRMVQYIVRHIDEAIQKEYVKAFYQPVVYSKGRTLCGVEALARWIDPKYGFLSPAAFVPALENAQLIYKLDIAVLRIVCRDIRRNLDEGVPAIPVSVNFSRFDFAVVDIVSMIDEVIREFDIPKELLHVEITESALTEDEEGLKRCVDKLHELGYAVWLDDFGAGYSSFNVLKDFSFDVLKLDMKFLVGFENNPKAKVVIRNVVSMAHEIGIQTVCEGVETKEQSDFLETVNCEKLQGYLYGKPYSYDELRVRIENKEYTLAKDLKRYKK